MNLGFALWGRKAASLLIEQRYGVRLTSKGCKYLARWGLTPQKPLQRAYEQRPDAVEKWLSDTYPEIARRAKGGLKTAAISHRRR